ncbi:MAG: bifunctional 2-C-methyl-D-erythritol 4-phosphate cytidylyltransferase/2-C-methyl-D-erythritol 2,4-cyclodiphosphate synthase [Proteobacteria bacterium]|nr:bifunctional 2-C-methyl-D-erythritol 4-phosphate cytidylyltransferase/2-C-methyl-D-erythritol 2,4-cyclodiphosphate synthase [Pseudomonadota bacterium]
MTIKAIIVAAGSGVRAGDGPPKQYRRIGGVPVLRRTVKAFLDHPDIDGVMVAANPEHADLYREAVGDLDLPSPALGGATRQASVLAGLKALEGDPPEVVLIHDAARAFVTREVISRVIDKVRETGHGAIPALAIADTLKEAAGGQITKTVDRKGLFTAQTPQGFPYSAILAAHQKAAGQDLTDDAAVAEAAGLKVSIVAGDKSNIKLTRKEDFREMSGDIRTGSGYDVHAFEAGDHVILGGVKIPHSKALRGHSDADAALHALTDALLGAIGEGDIGDHFPPSDGKWKNAPSDIFLKHAAELVAKKGGRITNVDLTIICEAPRIAPHREAMRKNIASLLGIALDRVNVKATTTEKLGFTGRGEGIAAGAIATVAMGG